MKTFEEWYGEFPGRRVSPELDAAMRMAYGAGVSSGVAAMSESPEGIGELVRLRYAVERLSSQVPPQMSCAQMIALTERGYENALVATANGKVLAILRGLKGDQTRIFCLEWKDNAWVAYQGPFVGWLKALLPGAES